MEKDIKNYILDKIKRGDIKKIPKFIFDLKKILWASFAFIIFLIILFLGSFILFVLQFSGLMSLPNFGIFGFQLLMGNFPWILLSLFLILILVLEALVSRYKFSYKKPLIYSFLIVIAVVSCASFFAWKTSLQERIYQNFKNDTFLQYFYNQYLNPPPDVFHPGTVLKMTINGFILEGSDKKQINVEISNNTKIPEGFKIFSGAKILVIGKTENGVIKAQAIGNAPATGRP